MTIKELPLIESISALAAKASGRANTLMNGIGDDTAVLANPGGPLLFAADMLMDGVHFRLDEMRPEEIGRKALAVNLSDIAAMAGTPLAVTVSLALPSTTNHATAVAVMTGLTELAKEFDVAVCGGDTNIWDHPLVIDVAVVGLAHPKGALLRSGARPGDDLFVTGPLGGTISGKHLRFTPRIKEASWLHSHYELSSMIDLSDGLAKDLRHVLLASGVGATLVRAAIPKNSVPEGRFCTVEEALCGGEDFELCFTAARDIGRKLMEDRNYPGPPIHKIGTITSEAGLRFDDGTDIIWHGYEHGVRGV